MGEAYRRFDEPYETNLPGHVHGADGVLIGTVILPDLAEIGPYAGKPAILFEFTVGKTKPYPPIVFFPGPDVAGLVELVRKAVEALPEAAAWKPAPADVRCPGCGAVLHHQAARRGACFSCYPKLPADEGVALVDETEEDS